MLTWAAKMDEPWEHYGKWNKPQKNIAVWFHLREVPRVFTFIEAEHRMVVAEAEGRREWAVIV